jgi:hypothetical protein
MSVYPKARPRGGTRPGCHVMLSERLRSQPLVYLALCSSSIPSPHPHRLVMLTTVPASHRCSRLVRSLCRPRLYPQITAGTDCKYILSLFDENSNEWLFKQTCYENSRCQNPDIPTPFFLRWGRSVEVSRGRWRIDRHGERV